MDPAALKAAVLGAQDIQAPGGNPLGASHADLQANAMRSTFQLPQSNQASNASGYNTSLQLKAAEEQAKLAAQKAADMADKAKYTQVKKADGGYDFFAPNGTQIDIATLTQRTGTKATDWLKDSENPIDTQYVEDTKNLNGLIRAVQSKDTATLEKYKKAFTDQGLPDITKAKVQDILDQYKNYYQRYYVTRQQDSKAWGTAPSASPFVPAPQGGQSFGVDSSGGIPG